MDDIETIRERMRRENDKRDEEAINEARKEGCTNKELDDLVERNARKIDRADEERLDRNIAQLEAELARKRQKDK